MKMVLTELFGKFSIKQTNKQRKKGGLFTNFSFEKNHITKGGSIL